jgi:hypothetical protein
MEHTEAAATMAAERYLLNEMEAAERDAFEEHFFNCAECAADVRDEALIAGAIRSEGRGVTKVVPFRPRVASRAGWLAAAAAVAGMAFLGYQNAQLRHGSARPEAAFMMPYAVSTGATRGEGAAEEIDAHGRAFGILAEIAADPQFKTYHLALRSNSKTSAEDDVDAREVAERAVLLRVPPSPAGSYTFTIEGVAPDGHRTPIRSESILVR